MLYAITARPTEAVGVIEIIIINDQGDEIANVTTEQTDFRTTAENMIGALKYPIGILWDGEIIVPDECSLAEGLENWFLEEYGYQPSEAELQAHPDPNDSYWSPDVC